MVTPVVSRLARTPTPTGGLALGIASLAMVWEQLLPSGGSIQWAGATIAGAICLALIIKFTLNPKILWLELSHPVIGSVVPTLAMALMIVSVTVSQLDTGLAIALWLLAIIAHFCFLVAFMAHRLQDWHLTPMNPSWFVPPIGPVVAVLTTPAPGLLPISETILWFGLGSYAVMLPLMIHRIMFKAEFPAAAKPTIAILAAPPNLCLAGYLTFTGHTADTTLVIGLLMLGTLMSVVVYLAFWELLRLPFSPAYAAFTFPTVIAASATFQAAKFMHEIGFSNDLVQALNQWGFVQITIATAIVAYVALRYTRYYGPRLKKPITA